MVTLNIIEINGLKQYQIMLGTSIITTCYTQEKAIEMVEMLNHKLGNNEII